MKLQKIIYEISCVISLISILAAIVLYCLFDSDNIDFIISILNGIFSGGILAFGVGVLSYFSERNKLIKDLFESAYDFTLYINTFEMGKMTNRELEIMLIKINDYHRTKIYFTECELSFVYHKSKLHTLIDELCSATHALNNRIADDYVFLTHEMYFSESEDIKRIKEHEFFVKDKRFPEYVDSIHRARKNLGEYMHYYEKELKK